MIDRNHTWFWATFYAGSICLCITVDILQHAAPLPFLPQQLEDRGHTSLEIAAVMGGYYWMGFLGGCLLTMYQIHGVLWGEYAEPTWRVMRSHIIKLAVGLLLGSLTLLVEARASDNEYASMHTVHLNCRLMQGFLGAFLFFYAYLLAATMFEGQQQVFALTLATISLNVAEVFGPFLGAWIFSLWGLDMTYYVLAFLSIVNNAMLVVTYVCMPRDPDFEPSETSALLSASPATASRASPVSRSRADTPSNPPQGTRSRDTPGSVARSPRSGAGSRAHSPRSARAWYGGAMHDRCLRLQRVLTDSWLLRSLIVIGPAAMVKSSFESILPLFGSNHGYDEYEVGLLFTMIAIGFIVASISLGYAWEKASRNARLIIVAGSLFLLGCVACTMLYTWGYETHHDLPISPAISYVNNGHHYAFYGCLGLYGVLLGLTHTGASLYLGEVIEELSDERSKGAANGVWNTGWELGGSIGFAVAGIAETDSWKQEQNVLTALGCLVFAACGAFLASFFTPFHGGLTPSEQLAAWDSDAEDAETKH